MDKQYMDNTPRLYDCMNCVPVVRKQLKTAENTFMTHGCMMHDQYRS